MKFSNKMNLFSFPPLRQGILEDGSNSLRRLVQSLDGLTDYLWLEASEDYPIFLPCLICKVIVGVA